MMRDTLENWQSEFLQLLWQVGGLAILLYVGSPQSKEGDDRLEAKIDEILRKVDPQHAEHIIQTLDEDYAGRHTDARHAHR
jgi:low affinity Fe/Cu permease